MVKRADDYARPENCSGCGVEARREFVPQRIYFSGTKVEEAEYNPGLGCIVRGKKEREEICKVKGLQEIGNEPIASVNKHYDKAREDKFEKSWAEADKGWQGCE